MTTYWCEHAWLPDGVADAVRIDVYGEHITDVTRDAPRTGSVLNGLTMPSFANTHSHAFHRALRGRTYHDRGTFWTWREQMYALASRVDPDSYYRLARGVYAEMVRAGFTSVGEFHYLHHAPGGRRYADPNAMSAALAHAAADAGIRLTLLDTCYLAGGFDSPLAEHQRRFADADVDAWAERVDAFTPADEHVLVGAAAHSVRAVPAEALPRVAEWAGTRPLHVHLSEQRGENRDCLAHHARTPTVVLAEAEVLGEHTVAVHGTHLTGADMGTLSRSGTRVSFCPTTERDLGDGIGPARELHEAGVRLCLGSDSHAVVDPLEEVRALELHERLTTESRGQLPVSALVAAGTEHAALGWNGVGQLAPGNSADLITVDLGSLRTAGTEPEGAVFAATAADVRDVLIAGRWVVADREHQSVRHAESVLAEEIEALWR